MKLACAAALIALAAVAIPPLSAATTGIDVAGVYDSNWGPIELRQHGRDVVGMYDAHHGALHGTLEGNLLRYEWHSDGGAGLGVFVVATNGQLVGTWGMTDDVACGGWNLTRHATAALAQP